MPRNDPGTVLLNKNPHFSNRKLEKLTIFAKETGAICKQPFQCITKQLTKAALPVELVNQSIFGKKLKFPYF